MWKFSILREDAQMHCLFPACGLQSSQASEGHAERLMGVMDDRRKRSEQQ